MKYLYKIVFSISALSVLFSCADRDPLEFNVEKPESVAIQEEINAYDPLKTYLGEGSSDFHLGAGEDMSTYTDKGVRYRLINSNFVEVTPKTGMNHGDVVQANGNLIVANVEEFLGVSSEAGLSVYGHSLVWHNNQNGEYLNAIIADQEIETDPNDANNSLVIRTPSANANIWDWQLNYVLPNPLTQGVEYTLKMRAKASSDFTVAFWRYDGSATNYGPDFAVGESWGDVSVTFTPSINATTLQFSFGTFQGDLYFDDMVLTASGSEENLIANGNFDEEILNGWEKPGWHNYTFLVEPVAAGPTTFWVNLVNNSDVESDDVSSFFATEKTIGPGAATIGAAGTGADGVGHAIVVNSGDAPANEWDTQFFVQAPQQLLAGQAYRFSMKVKADKPATINSQSHNNPGGYVHWSMVGSPSVTTEWQTYESSGTISAEQAGANGMNTIAFNLSVLAEANTYYFDDIVWEIEEEGDKRPLTPEEKADTLSWAIEKWISGIMTASNEYVNAWDVVKDPLDDTNPNELRSGEGESLEDDEFYWQDYLGKDYAVMAFNLARQYGADNSMLFISESNLESNLAKCQALIDYVDYIEGQGATVDGVATQMHINVNSDKDNIAQMFQMLAGTGKMIKVSELNVAIAETPTPDLLQQQADMYQYVLNMYEEHVPADQRYGVTLWEVTDTSGDQSTWKGLWGSYENHFTRKAAYTSFAESLKGL